jgi:hypothetical protein
MLTPRVLGTSYCVLLLQVLCGMKKLLSGVKRALSSGPSSRALVHATVTMDRKTRHGLCPLCHRNTGPWGRAIILHMMMF